MGGRGSGALPGDTSNHGGGRPKRAAVAVVGSGSPIKPDDLPMAVSECWDQIAEKLSGLVYSQDSDALTYAAWLMWQQQQYRDALLVNPLDEELTRLSLAVGRSLSALWSQFGMTPRSRQLLLAPKQEEELDEFEEMLKGRK